MASPSAQIADLQDLPDGPRSVYAVSRSICAKHLPRSAPSVPVRCDNRRVTAQVPDCACVDGSQRFSAKRSRRAARGLRPVFAGDGELGAHGQPAARVFQCYELLILQRGFEPVSERGQHRRGPRRRTRGEALGDRGAGQIGSHGQPLRGQGLGDMAVDGRRAHSRPVLARRVHPCRGRCDGDMPARAAHLQHPVLGHDQPWGRRPGPTRTPRASRPRRSGSRIADDAW
jgi:hypothetical protein